ncbi:MAG: hypothetical protein A3E01_15680 [Gammaproteobacteria bacterium RIFCSPHIGHO2_12_FULL_63_22]|nr:MAG: hypothetical protein A3E01_15680 [Gammaproteobacteria bacterium RIFCSPHIGHO2_12_FULL_63_22]
MSIQLDHVTAGVSKPDSHLEVLLGNLATGDSRLVQALLRVDLGARINVDSSAGSIDIEGRFRREDVILAIEALGYFIVSIEAKPRSPMRSSAYLIA